MHKATLITIITAMNYISAAKETVTHHLLNCPMMFNKTQFIPAMERNHM